MGCGTEREPGACKWRVLYRCSECRCEEVTTLTSATLPPLPPRKENLCIGCGLVTVTLVGVLSEARFQEWRSA